MADSFRPAQPIVSTALAEFSIRPLSADDLDDISSLFVACFSAPPWGEGWSDDAARARLSALMQAASCRGVVALRDGAIVGMALGQIEHWLNDSLFLLQEFCVLPKQQNQGIGRALLSELLPGLAAKEQVAAVYLLTDRASPAQAFYEKFGFAPSAKKLVMGAAIGSLTFLSQVNNQSAADDRLSLADSPCPTEADFSPCEVS